MIPQYNLKTITFLLFTIYISLSDLITLNTLLLNQYGVKNQEIKWKNLRQALTLPKYDTIKIKDNIVTMEGLQKLFSENLTNIKNFFISQTSLDLKAIQYLMKNDRTFEFEKLSIMNSNFLCEDFSYLVQRRTKITSLFLNQNRISKQGFKYLQKLTMNLTDLSLSSNSLLSDQAVDSVISFGLKQIINISLSHTSISGDNVIKMLRNMDLNKLRILDLNSNLFSTEFYQKFSQFSFQSLIELNLGHLNIDEEGFSFLKNMHFPSLESLLLDGNQLNDQLGAQFVTKKNMPKLKMTSLGKYLIIEDNNFISSVFIRHLKKQEFKFEQFSCKIKKIDQGALQQMTTMDTSELKMFLYSSLSTTPEIISRLIRQTNFTKLQSLELKGMKNRGDYFHEIVKVRWPKLENLLLDSIDYINQTIYKGRVIFPQLKLLALDIDLQSLDDEVSIVNFVKNAQKIAPKLEQLSLSLIASPQLIGSIFNGSLTNSLTRPLSLTINVNIPIQNTFSLILHPTEQAKVLKLNLSPVFMSFLGDTALKYLAQLSQSNLNIQQIIEQEGEIRDLLDVRSHITKFQNNLHKNFNFSELQQLYETVELNFLRKLLAKNPHYAFQNLQVLQFLIEENTQFQLLQFLQFPKLNTLNIISVEQISDDSSQFLLQCIDKKFTHIHTLNIQLLFSKRLTLKFLKDGQFGNLRKFQIDMKGILPQDFVQMQSYIKFQRLQSLYAFEEAFINNNLKFLGDSGARLVDLQFHNILFNPGVLKQLCPLNFQFMNIIEFSICGINDQDFLQLIDCIRGKHPNEQNIFLPKAKVINLQNNYISSVSLSKWMELGLPLLASMRMDSNMDGQKFNSVFLSPYSKRLGSFNLDSSKINGIDESIDKRNFRRLQIFLIENIKLFDTDIKLIANYQFFSLLHLGIGLKKVDNCSVLKSLNKIINNVVSVAIQIEDSPLLSSDCMGDVEELKNQITIQQLTIKGNSYYGQISEFVGFLLKKTANLTNIQLIQTYMKEDQKVSKLIDGISENKLSAITFVSCFLDDKSVKKIFTKNLEGINHITLSKNPFSSEGLSVLQNKKLKQLTTLDLTETNIGDKGIEYLATNQFPKLNQLLLKNSEITGKGIQLLNNLKAKKLIILDLSDNQLTVDDVMKLNPRTFPILQRIILFPELVKLDYERLTKHFQKNTDSAFFTSVSIDTDVKDLYSYYQQEQYYGYYDDDEQQDEQLTQ